MSYRQKYYKYKQKYFQLKKELDLVGGIAPNDPEFINLESISQEEVKPETDLKIVENQPEPIESGPAPVENQPEPIESGPAPVENNEQDNVTDTVDDDNFDVVKILDKIINK